MAVKTFTTGEVLTAADTNTYLANSGLQYVASGTFTNAAAFDVTGFSSTYDFYKLFMSIQATTTTGTITGVVYSGSTARNTGYYGASMRIGYLGTSGVVLTRNNGANFGLSNSNATQTNQIDATIRGIGNRTFNISLQYMDNENFDAMVGGYSLTPATSSFDMIRISCTNNITGQWNLMGVRKG